tara:strand:+ start:137 stop:409 length:273 start_codon:yes stop_codon:yes gene_type:complete
MASKKKYTVTLCSRLYNYEEYTVEASSPEEAVELASEADEPDEYQDPEHDTVFVYNDVDWNEETVNKAPQVREADASISSDVDCWLQFHN